MGISVKAIFAEVGLLPVTPVPWRQAIPWETPGVYVLALSSDPQTSSGLPQPNHLPTETAARWLHDQPIIYIGKAGGPGKEATLKRRLAQFYRHRWGERAPHNGGQDVHLLECPIWVFAASASEPRPMEKAMIAAFKKRVGHRPFANRSG